MSNAFWKTSLSAVEKNKILIRGYRVQDLMEHCTFGDIIYLTFTGELPTGREGQIIDLEVEIGGGSDLHVLDRAAARKQRGPGRGLPRGEHRHCEAAHDRLRVIVGDAGATHPRALAGFGELRRSGLGGSCGPDRRYRPIRSET